jgi:hypothetical protein
MLIGSKFAFNTNTGNSIASSTTFANYSTGFAIGKSAYLSKPRERIMQVNFLLLDAEIDL